MELEPSDVEPSRHTLRQNGSVTEVQGVGRVPKYRHNMYQWLGVDKVELAVMAELLLRGQQTIGELRGRANRMEAIGDVNQLKPVLERLIDKRLVIQLSPPGRGQIVTHNLYTDREMQKVRESVAGDGLEDSANDDAALPAFDPPLTERIHLPLDDIQSKMEAIQRLLDQAVRRIEQLESKLS
jgi:uncharacterized protein YceH (UPF0502 family)